MSSPHNAPYYFVPRPLAVADGWRHIDARHDVRRRRLGQRRVLGPGRQRGRHPLAMLVVLYFWFGDAIGESESGSTTPASTASYRWSMSWFIFSEVMFFGAFFGALFYARAISMPWLADLDHKVIWPDFAGHWGNIGPAGTVESFNTMGPFPIPTINTALLLTSGVTLTIAHHALRAGHRAKTAFWLFATILLGASSWASRPMNTTTPTPS
jgi:cytochrome c oxidase subunit 3